MLLMKDIEALFTRKVAEYLRNCKKNTAFRWNAALIDGRIKR